MTDRGTIGRDAPGWRAGCGRCGSAAWTWRETRCAALRWFVALGWLHTRFRGWVCPECAKQGEG